MLVATWLRGIGLEYAVPVFEAAGIVTPVALSELDPTHFEALGVLEAEDRRKLFYLVQRVKQQRKVGSDQKSEKENANTVTAPAVASSASSKLVQPKKRVIPSATSSSSRSLSSDDDVDDYRHKDEREEGEDADDDNHKDDADHFVASETASSSSKTRAAASTAVSKTEVTTTNGKRLSGVPQPKKRASYSSTSSTSSTAAATSVPTAASSSSFQPPKSMRTGKQLSTIPSNALAPMSPLVAWPPPPAASASSPPQSLERKPQNQQHNNALGSRTTTYATSQSSISTNRRSRGSLVGGGSGGGTSRSSCGGRGGLSSNNGSDHDVETTMGKAARGRRTLARGQSLQGTETATAAASSRRMSRSSSNSHSEPSSSFATQIRRLWEQNDASSSFSPKQQLESSTIPLGQRVSVVVRKRPVTQDVDILQCLFPNKLLVYQPRTRVDLRREISTIPFSFDAVIDEIATNVDLYQRVVRPLLLPNLQHLQEETVEGGERGGGAGGQCATTIFCFGQTGSGKTHTLLGRGRSTATTTTDHKNDDGNDDDNNHKELGLYQLAAQDVFAKIHELPEDFRVSVSLFELYDRKVLDLLAHRAAVPCWEDASGKVQFPGLSLHTVESAEELVSIIERGDALRSTGTTSKNSDSSRSHAVLQLQIVEQEQPQQRRRQQQHELNNKQKKTKKNKEPRSSTLTFIDLAGSERGADTALFSNSTRLEGAEINTSLLALKEVLRAMSTEGSAHIPFRGSKLTQVLKESLIAETSSCVMIACVSPNLGHCEPTLNTLRYANCLKEFEKSSSFMSSSKQNDASSRGGIVRNHHHHQQQLGGQAVVKAGHHTNDSSTTLAISPALSDSVRSSSHSPPPQNRQQQQQPRSNSHSPAPQQEGRDMSPSPAPSHTRTASGAQSEISTDVSALLDDILSSSSAASVGGGVDVDSVSSIRHQQGRRHRRIEAAQPLFATHKEAMTDMLTMVKKEMALVCNHDSGGGDTNLTLQYIQQVLEMQEEQLSYIVKLREQLLQFYEAVDELDDDGDGNDDNNHHNNHSFEDLRD